MRRSGDRLDNAMAERCFATRTAEFVDRCHWATRATARTAIYAWLAACYNRQRSHSALTYQPLAIFEEEVVVQCSVAER